MAAAMMLDLRTQMKTDAYTECRGVGRIGANNRPGDDPGQAVSDDAAITAQGNLPC